MHGIQKTPLQAMHTTSPQQEWQPSPTTKNAFAANASHIEVS